MNLHTLNIMQSKQLDFFHDTIGLLPSERLARESKALNQTERIIEWFKRNKGQSFTPSQCWEAIGYAHVPLTSIRRGITDATKMGELVKCKEKRIGLYGELNYTWTYATK